MSRKSIYMASQQKKSEYRRNFLPFDYYDFCITAKENENLRCRNKLRDYLHTPFDWDEDLDIYIEPVTDNLNQSCQTKPAEATKIRGEAFKARQSHEKQEADEYAQLVKDYENELASQQKTKTSKKAKKKNKKPAAVKVSVEQQASPDADDFSRNGVHVVAHHKSSHKPTIKRTQSTFVKPFGCKNASPAFFKEIQDKKVGNFELLKNSASMAVQTPVDWTLRENKNKVQANKGKLKFRNAFGFYKKIC